MKNRISQLIARMEGNRVMNVLIRACRGVWGLLSHNFGLKVLSLFLAVLRKIILLIPLIFILPHLLPDPVFAVFLAEPVSDICAALVTVITFFMRLEGILAHKA